jgi:minichromosome maintenance protein 10
MDDPREEEVNSDDCLTEDSQDEVKDLVKEFEAKLEEAKRKKRQRKLEQIKIGVTLSQSGESPFNSRDLNAGDSPFNKSDEKASDFINKLNQYSYDLASAKAMAIDYSKRVFEFNTDGVQMKDPKDVNEIDKYSGQYLRKRYLSRENLDRILLSTDSNLKILKINKLLAKINKSNNFQEPMYNNWGFVGFVLKKDINNTKENKKFMKLTIGDFDRSIDIMFFGDTLQKYWKLTLGDVIIILNPIVCKFHYLPSESNRVISGFNLKVDQHSVNSIIEIGSVRDFAFCTSLNKSTNLKCSNIVNISKSEMCEFHINLKFKSGSNKRMELNGSVQMKSPQKPKYNNLNFNENTHIYSGSQAGFLNNPKQYQNPKLLSQESKRRKMLDERANKSLEKKLASLGNNSTVKMLNLVRDQSKPSKEQVAKILEAKQRSFPTHMIGKIGFDPTNNDSKYNSTGIEGYKSPTRKRQEIERVRELYKLSNDKSKHKQLTSSPENRKQKRDKWNSNLKMLKTYQKELKLHEINLTSSDKLDMALRSKNQEIEVRNIFARNNEILLEPGFTSSDDSDLEIEFENDDAKKQFQKKIGYKPK